MFARKLRAHPLFFIVWFLLTVVCAWESISFIHILTNTWYPGGQGMESLGWLKVYSVWGTFLPFVTGFALCLFLRPRISSSRRAIVIPTVLLTGAAALSLSFIPRKAELAYDVAFEFVDPQGQSVPELTVRYTLETPQFLRLKDYQPPIPQVTVVRGGHLIISKKRIEQLKLEVEELGFYHLGIDVPQWVSTAPDYIHKIDFWWRRDKARQTRDDSMSTSLNWRPVRDKVLQVIMLRHSDTLQLPYSPYTNEDYRELDANK